MCLFRSVITGSLKPLTVINYVSLSLFLQPVALLSESIKNSNFLVNTYECKAYGRCQYGLTFSQIVDEGFVFQISRGEVKIFGISNCIEPTTGDPPNTLVRG